MSVSANAAEGRVFLVGAGPGDPELITVRGLRCLQRAEVLIYDRLVHRDLLAEAPAGAERLYAGKAPGRHHRSQEEINALMVDRARRGRRVVRLKGGDPFIFGRGSEESQACAAAGVPCEAIPGLSSATAVPAWAGIPLTHRGLAASFAVFTAHRAADLDDLPWSTLATLDTLVILMGVARLPYVVSNLRRYGRASDTPAGILENGTYDHGRIVVGSLADLPDRAAAAGIRSPAIIVVGAVVALRTEKLDTVAAHRSTSPAGFRAPGPLPWSAASSGRLPSPGSGSGGRVSLGSSPTGTRPNGTVSPSSAASSDSR